MNRRWWLTPPAIALLVLALLLVALLAALWLRVRLPPDRGATIWVSLFPDVGRDLRGGGPGANALVTVTMERGRVADAGPLGERVAALVAPNARQSSVAVHDTVDGRRQVVDVHLAEPLVPRRLDTQATQQTLSAAGFRWLVVGVYVEQHSQVLPRDAAKAGGCWGDNGLSCEWRLATGGPPLRFEVRPVPAAGR